MEWISATATVTPVERRAADDVIGRDTLTYIGTVLELTDGKRTSPRLMTVAGWLTSTQRVSGVGVINTRRATN